VGALQDQLNAKANVTIWNQGVFALNASSVDSLIDGLKNSDFGVFVFSPDDIRTIREETLEVASRALSEMLLKLPWRVERLNGSRGISAISARSAFVFARRSRAFWSRIGSDIVLD
jgi:hypothetical protein